MRACPFCAEQVQDAAIVCPHCGRETSKLLAASNALQSCGCSLLVLAVAIPVLLVLAFVLYGVLFGGGAPP